MTGSIAAFPRVRLQTLALPALLAGLALAACSNDNPPASTGLPASTSYSGIYAGTSGATGPVSITFATAVSAPPIAHPDIAGASAAPNNADGTVGVGGIDVAISGTLDGDALHMTGDGGSLVLDGTLSKGVITGTWTEGTSDNGNFTAASNTDGAPARNYCGYYSGTTATDPPVEEFGSFSFVVAGTFLQGVAVDDGGDVIAFTGTAVPGANGGTFKVNQTSGTDNLTINNGTYDQEGTSGLATGNYTTSSSGVTASTGTFYGNLGCPAL